MLMPFFQGVPGEAVGPGVLDPFVPDISAGG